MPDRLELHRARVQKGIDLAHISASTALNPIMAARIDAGRFEDLPAGVYARSYIRTFAKAVGVPPDEALASLEAILPSTEDPLPVLRERAPKSPFEGLWTFIAAQATPLDALPTQLTSARARRAGAVTVDALLLTAIGIVMIVAAAWTSGSRVDVLLKIAGAELALMFALPVGLYFILLEPLYGRTLGDVVCQSEKSMQARRVVRIRHWTYGRSTPGSLARAATRRHAGRHDRGAEPLALRSAPARR